ncbi:RIP metalloprotease RseP [Pseudomonas aeruginosa]|uniref:RIP metalloprotease RseP n=1 Tax=Pseudomonas aeruginosa TaxID=287 RepID=UPI002FEDE6D9
MAAGGGQRPCPSRAARPAQGAARRRSAGCCPGTGGARRGQGPERLHGVAGTEWPAEMLREVSYGPLEAVGQALSRTWTMSLLTLDSIKKMLLGELSVKNLSGPITIAKVAGASAQSGVGDFLNFLAYLSISLGVLNLLPIPVLDGGHLLFYLVEWVRGRPLSERVQAWGMQIGISLVVGVMLLALVNDLSRL